MMLSFQSWSMSGKKSLWATQIWNFPVSQNVSLMTIQQCLDLGQTSPVLVTAQSLSLKAECCLRWSWFADEGWRTVLTLTASQRRGYLPSLNSAGSLWTSTAQTSVLAIESHGPDLWTNKTTTEIWFWNKFKGIKQVLKLDHPPPPPNPTTHTQHQMKNCLTSTSMNNEWSHELCTNGVSHARGLGQHALWVPPPSNILKNEATVPLK